MCNPACIEFGQRHLHATAIRGQCVLEVGACDVNGSLRSIVESHAPSGYVGVDIRPGPGVDEICDVGELTSRFGPAAFDLVLCTEVLEHVRDWRGAVRELSDVLRPGGVLLVTTRSAGFPVHCYPFDYWRYELADMRHIFAEMSMWRLESDPFEPGVFMLAGKSAGHVATETRDYELYSVVKGRRVRDITSGDIAQFKVCRRLWRALPRSVRPEWALPPQVRRVDDRASPPAASR